MPNENNGFDPFGICGVPRFSSGGEYPGKIHTHFESASNEQNLLI